MSRHCNVHLAAGDEKSLDSRGDYWWTLPV